MAQRASAVLVSGATIIATLLAGCGSSGSGDKAQIAAIVKHEGTAPETLCGHLTEALLSRLGGKTGCLRQAAGSSADPTTHATSVRIHDRSATAVVVDRAGEHTVSFVKQRGGWKVAGGG